MEEKKLEKYRKKIEKIADKHFRRVKEIDQHEMFASITVWFRKSYEVQDFMRELLKLDCIDHVKLKETQNVYAGISIRIKEGGN